MPDQSTQFLQPPHNPIRELCPDSVYAIGGFVPATRPTTWIMPGLEGSLVVSCYLLRDNGQALVIDTGLAIHRDAILDGLSRLTYGTGARSLIMTRREPDAIINLPALVKHLSFDAVYCGGALNPLDFFERVDQRSVESHISAIAHSQVNWLQPGTVLPIGRLELEVMRTRLLVLPKNHFYERRTRTLFASDSFGFLSQPDTAALAIVSAPDSRLSRDTIARYLRHKFDWLCGADTSAIEAEFNHLLDGYAIDRICCTYGGVIEGSALIRHVLMETVAALRLLSREPVMDRMRGFDTALLGKVAAIDGGD